MEYFAKLQPFHIRYVALNVLEEIILCIFTVDISPFPMTFHLRFSMHT